MSNRLKKIWAFLWKSDSIWSWIVSFALAFLIVKFLIYPGLGMVLGTDYPIVAVVSSSMKHDGSGVIGVAGFSTWWTDHEEWYERNGISEEDFQEFDFKNGFNKGDLMVLVGVPPQNIKRGDILVFNSNLDNPVIHRVVKVWEEDGKHHFQTKGDNNMDSGYGLDELDISEDRVIGKAVFRVPYLGWLKIAFSSIV